MLKFTDNESCLLKIVLGDDFAFYERFVSNAPLEEQQKFFDTFPEFLNDLPDVTLSGNITADVILSRIN